MDVCVKIRGMIRGMDVCAQKGEGRRHECLWVHMMGVIAGMDVCVHIVEGIGGMDGCARTDKENRHGCMRARIKDKNIDEELCLGT